MNRVLAVFSLLVLLFLSLLVFLVARPEAAPDAVRPALAWLDRMGGGGSSTRPEVHRSARLSAQASEQAVSSPRPPVIAEDRHAVASVVVQADGSPPAGAGDSGMPPSADGAARAAAATATAAESGPVAGSGATPEVRTGTVSDSDASVRTADSGRPSAPATRGSGEATVGSGANPLAGATAVLADALTRNVSPANDSPAGGTRTTSLPVSGRGPTNGPDAVSGRAADPVMASGQERGSDALPSAARSEAMPSLPAPDARAAKPANLSDTPGRHGSGPAEPAIARAPQAGQDRPTTRAGPGTPAPVAMLLPSDAPVTRPARTEAARAQQSSIRNFLQGEVVEFETGRDVLTPAGQRVLEQVSAIIASHRDTIIVVQGHTDDVGDDASNLELSQSRALRARGYLVAQGIDPERLRAQGFGERRPVASNDSGAGRKRNRRIDFIVVER